MPTTLVGVLVFVASVGPGYVFVKVVERWRPYSERTALREAAEIVVTGCIATLLGLVAALALGKASGFLDVKSIASRPGRYFVVHAGHAGLGVLVVLGVSYGLAWAVARFSPGKGAKVFPDSAWYANFERRLPKNHAILATVELKDGRRVTGLVHAFTAEHTAVDEREITLTRSTADTMKVALPPDGELAELGDQFIMLRGSDIANIAASYVTTEPAEPAKHRWRLQKPSWLPAPSLRPSLRDRSDR